MFWRKNNKNSSEESADFHYPKYIVLKSKNNMPNWIVVFPKAIMHSRMLEALRTITHINLGEAISAGFVKNGKTVGESTSLGLKSNPDDFKLIDIDLDKKILESWKRK